MSKTVTLACLSDLHAGSTRGPCPQPVELDDGATYEPSKIQRYLNGKLDGFYDAVENARQDRLGLLLNGDLVDGQVKESAQVVSPHPHVEFAIIKDILARAIRLKPDFVIVTRGTAAHVGKSGHKDEAVAHWLAKEQKLKVVRDPDTNKYSSYLATFALEGHLIWATHHGKVGSVEWSNVISNQALQIYLSCVKRGLQPPELVIQAHNHRFDDSYGKHPTRVVQQGAFQLKTDHAFKVVPTALTDVGGVIVQATKGRPLDVERVQFFPDEPTVWSYTA